MEEKRPILLLWLLALGGFVPFAFLAAAVWWRFDLPVIASPLSLFLVWSIAILTFLGGIRWGLAISAQPLDVPALVISVIPCIIGWFAFFASQETTVLLLGMLFVFQGVWDMQSFRPSKLAWFVPIRLTLTGLVCLAHLAVLLAIS